MDFHKSACLPRHSLTPLSSFFLSSLKGKGIFKVRSFTFASMTTPLCYYHDYAKKSENFIFNSRELESCSFEIKAFTLETPVLPIKHDVFILGVCSLEKQTVSG